MGLDSVMQAFQKGTESFSELEFEALKPAGLCLFMLCKELWPLF